MKTTHSKKILITFARSYLSLDLARKLHAAGYSIYVADSMKFHVSRFSNVVEKSFQVPSPRFNSDEYLNAILKIVENEKIDFLIPMFEEVSCLSRAKDRFPSHCELFCPSFELYHQLHNKWTFQKKLEELGIESIKSFLIKTKEDLAKVDFKTPFAFKACYSRASQSIRKIYPGRPLPDFPIEEHNPWVAQQWLEGSRFCTYTVCRSGKVFAQGVYTCQICNRRQFLSYV